MTATPPPPGPPRQTADLASGLLWVAFGGAVAFESWRMPRLEEQHINPYTIPGLLPGLLGTALAVFGAALALRGLRGAGPARGEAAERAAPWRVALGLVLCLGFGFAVVGQGPPFWLGAALFLFLAVFLFELPERRAAGTVARGAVRAALVAGIGAPLVAFVFQEIFLVRLP